MIQRSTKNVIRRNAIARNLRAATNIVAVSRSRFPGQPLSGISKRAIQTCLNEALSFARGLPDNPGNRAIRASIVAALEALSHDA